MYCHSLPVGHRRRCDETSLSFNIKVWKVTHTLFVGHGPRYETASKKKVHCNPHPYGDSARCGKTAFQKMYVVTHKLLVKGQDMLTDVMILPFEQMSDVTHHLFVIVQDVIRLLSDKYIM